MKNVLEYKRAWAVAGASLLGVAGTCLGYLWAHKELEEEFNRDLEKLLDIEAQRLQQHYAIRYKDVDPEDISSLDLPDGEEPVIDEQHIIIPKSVLATAQGRADVMEMLRMELESSDPDEDESDDEEGELQNAFDMDDTPQYDFEEIMSERTGDDPFVISKDEYYANNAQYETYDLTFFEKDGVLIDDQENAIPDTNEVVGDRNLQRFGVMSEDNNVVYIQNDKSNCLFRIQKSPLSASQALWGQPDEDEVLEHSSMRRRRPRGDDG